MTKNQVIKGLLSLINMILLLMQYYNIFVFLTIEAIILFVKTPLLDVKKVTSQLSLYTVFYILLTVFSFYLNPPIRYEYYLIIAFLKYLLILGLFWLYLSVIKGFNKESLIDEVNVKNHLIVLFVVLSVIHMIYFLAFSPGNMYIDSYSQWGQAMGGIELDNWHPVFSTLLLRVSYYLSNSPILFTFLQVIGSIFLLLYISKILLRKGTKPWVVYTFIFYILSASVLLPSMVTLYKDNLYNLSLVFMTLFIFEILDSKGAWLKNSWMHMALFLLNAVFVMLIRHNGVYVLVASMILFILFMPKVRVHMIVNLAVLLGIYLVFTGPVFNRYNIEEGSASEKYSILLQHIGSTIANDGKIEQEEQNYLETLLPLEIWEEKYTEEMVDPVKFHSSYNKEIINQDQLKFLGVWWNVVSNNPGLALKGHLQQVRPLWDIHGWEHGLAGSLMFHFFINSPKEYYDPYLQEYTLETDTLRNLISDYSYWTNEYDIETKPFITSLSALSLFMLILTSIMLVRQRQASMLLMFVPVVMNIGTLVLTMPAYNMRYVLAMIIIGHISLFIPRIVEKNQTILNNLKEPIRRKSI